MYLDTQALFSDAQAITATAASTNIYDTFAEGRDISNGEPLRLLIQVTEDFDNLTSLKVDVETDDNEAFSSATVLQSSTVVLADLKAGKRFPIAFSPEGNERYIRLNYTVAGTPPAAGKVTAGFVMDVQSNR